MIQWGIISQGIIENTHLSAYRYIMYILFVAADKLLPWELAHTYLYFYWI